MPFVSVCVSKPLVGSVELGSASLVVLPIPVRQRIFQVGVHRLRGRQLFPSPGALALVFVSIDMPPD